MVFEQIEKLKDDYTDKYVVVDDTRPELRRFSGLTGMVRTVNMSGRALVEFDRGPNTGWFDIDLDFLRVVDQPQQEEPAAKAKPKAPAKKKAPAGASELEKARSGKKATELSMEEMLAAARGGAAAPKAPAKPAADSMSVDDILAAARKDGGAPAKSEPKAEAKPTEPKAEGAMPTGAAAQAMSMEEMLAAARGNKPAEASTPASSEAVEEPEAEPVAAEPEPEPEPETTDAPSSGAGGVTAEAARGMSVEEAVEYCRNTDG